MNGTQKMPPQNLKLQNLKTLGMIVGVVVAMIILSFASVPLYDLFCRVTGFGGTTQIGEKLDQAPTTTREMTIRFDASIHPDLPWSFKPVQGPLNLPVGADMLAFYEATNLSQSPLTGTASFNVTPLKAGQYFVKVACFCFTEQTLAPGEKVEMPVSFYIDPAILNDKNMEDVTTITLSYTFFRQQNQAHIPLLRETYNG